MVFINNSSILIEFAKRFRPDDKDLPYIIPFTFNDLPSTIRGGRIIDPNKVLKEAIEREEKLKKLYEKLKQKQDELNEKYSGDYKEEITEEEKRPEPDGMYL